jgi:hypothetical protein
MGWLRRDKDLIGLVLPWGILVQALILSFTAGVHAATLAAEPAATILCTTKGALAGTDVPGKSHQAPHWCCSLACRIACGAAHAGGILPTTARVPLPSFTAISAPLPLLDAAKAKVVDRFSAQPAPLLSPSS